MGLENSGSNIVTLFSINNASAAPQLAHVTLWTDVSRPTVDFDVYLTGYDVITSNLASLFTFGQLPATLLPSELAADNGPLSAAPSGDFLTATEECAAIPLPAELPPLFLKFIRYAHTGLPVPAPFTEAGLCATFDKGWASPDQGVATGYITVDVVNQCSTKTANSGTDYFGTNGSLGITENTEEANVLWGDFFIVDPTNNFAHGDTLVHIEANGDFAPRYTYYGRYFGSAFTGHDAREALATTWALRYFDGTAGPFDDDTDVICWRDTGTNTSSYLDVTETGLCKKPANKLLQDQIVLFDEDEDSITVTIPSDIFSPVPSEEPVGFEPCPWETQRVDVAEFGDVFPFGWMYLNLNQVGQGDAGGILQSHVSVIHQASGLFSVGYSAVNYDNAETAVSTCLGTGPGDLHIPNPKCRGIGEIEP